MSIHDDTYNIPTIIQNTQLEKIIQSEIFYKKLILRDIKELRKNFTTSNIKTHLKVRFIATYLAKLFKVYHLDKSLTQDIVNGIDSVLLSREHIGTDASFNILFESYLYSKLDISTNPNKAGEIIIKLLDNIKSPFRRFIMYQHLHKVVDEVKIYKFKKIMLNHNGKQRKLIFNYMPLNYTSSIFEFIKSLIPVGRVVRIKNKDNQEITKQLEQSTVAYYAYMDNIEDDIIIKS
ncbi:DUF735 family protein [Candidatus Borreliella tachyglossi]|uniref:DUF735 family protein n=1 Tax=Candidatus Borreliella tachyglossi TaxID=1964448 RepID=UPI004042AE8E